MLVTANKLARFFSRSIYNRDTNRFRYIHRRSGPAAGDDRCGHVNREWRRCQRSYRGSGKSTVLFTLLWCKLYQKIQIWYCSLALMRPLRREVILSWSLMLRILLQLEGQLIAMLVQNMERLDEAVKEESEGVHNTLCEWCILYCCCLEATSLVGLFTNFALVLHLSFILVSC